MYEWGLRRVAPRVPQQARPDREAG